MPWDDEKAREHVSRTERQLGALETLPDTAARAQALDALQSVAELYGQCLDRMMGLAAQSGDGLVRTLLADELIARLLLVHDLHPEPAEVRVRQALEELRPRLAPHGAAAELLSVEGPVARVRLSGADKDGTGCGSSAGALENAVREAVAGAAPEIEHLETEGVERPRAAQTLIPVEDLFRPRPPDAEQVTAR